MSDITPAPETKSFVSANTWSVEADGIYAEWLADQNRHYIAVGWDVRLYLNDSDALKLYHQLGESIMSRNTEEPK